MRTTRAQQRTASPFPVYRLLSPFFLLFSTILNRAYPKYPCKINTNTYVDPLAYILPDRHRDDRCDAIRARVPRPAAPAVPEHSPNTVSIPRALSSPAPPGRVVMSCKHVALVCPSSVPCAPAFVVPARAREGQGETYVR